MTLLDNFGIVSLEHATIQIKGGQTMIYNVTKSPNGEIVVVEELFSKRQFPLKEVFPLVSRILSKEEFMDGLKETIEAEEKLAVG